MKTKNIRFSAFAYDKDFNLMSHKFFCTEQAMSNWANKWYKVDEEATVEVYNFATGTLYTTYHA